MTNAIEMAVAPLKDDAMNAAEKYAREVVARVRKELAAAGNDLDKCAPYPKSFGVSRAQYHIALGKYQLFRNLCESRVSSRSFQDPDFADVSAKKVSAFVAEARKDAAVSYDAYVAKLTAKIGAVETAELEGRGLWSHSILNIVKADGSKQTWKTQMILNVSKLGKVFNQWPTRQIAGVKAPKAPKIQKRWRCHLGRCPMMYIKTNYKSQEELDAHIALRHRA